MSGESKHGEGWTVAIVALVIFLALRLAPGLLRAISSATGGGGYGGSSVGGGGGIGSYYYPYLPMPVIPSGLVRFGSVTPPGSVPPSTSSGGGFPVGVGGPVGGRPLLPLGGGFPIGVGGGGSGRRNY